MILDDRNEFGDALSVVLTAGAAWQNIGDVIDLRKATNTLANVGAGEPVYLIIAVTTTLLGTDDNTGTFQLRLASDSTGTIHASTSTVHWTGTSFLTDDAVATAGITAGDVYAKIALPIEDTYEQFLGIQALVTTKSTTAGAINAFLTKDPDSWRAYTDAVS